MVYQTPLGARDLLPLDVAQKRWIEERLQQVFHRWSYHRIITSTLERLDTLMAGGAIQRAGVIQLQEAEEALGLRPELTASIARAAVTRMAGTSFPLRLYYNANVFRRSPDASPSRQQELYQAGVELIGVGGLLANAEVLLLLVDCLESLGIQQWSILLGEAGLTRSLFSIFPEGIREQVRQAIAHLDRLALETMTLPEDLRDRALLLFDLRGNSTEVLQKVVKLDLAPAQRAALNNLKSLIDLLQEQIGLDLSASSLSKQPAIPLTLDLSLIQTIDYYTGVVFEVVVPSPGGLVVLGRGGRYDQLLGLYHPQGKTYPGIGFALQIEQLHQVLLATQQLPDQTPTSDWLVVPVDRTAYAAAIAHAHTLRSAPDSLRVELDLGNRTPAENYDYAQHRCIAQIAWVKATGDIAIETVKTPQ
jgi:ATP phosphoribosyltransferase regulatory subunit